MLSAYGTMQIPVQVYKNAPGEAHFRSPFSGKRCLQTVAAYLRMNLLEVHHARIIFL